MGFSQGKYIVKNPSKYRGDPNKVRYMSSWELSVYQMLDADPRIIEWAAESIPIKYLKPTDNRLHTYYPDYYVKYKDKRGRIHQEVIEIKPLRETQPPKSKSKKTRLQEEVTWAINISKWRAAQKFCNKYGLKFRLLTEKDIFL